MEGARLPRRVPARFPCTGWGFGRLVYTGSRLRRSSHAPSASQPVAFVRPGRAVPGPPGVSERSPPDRTDSADLADLRLRARILLFIAAGFAALTVVDVLGGIRCRAEGMCYGSGLWYAWELLAALPPGLGGLAMWLRVRRLDARGGREEELGPLLRGRPVSGMGVLGRVLLAVALYLVLHNFAYHEVSHPGRERAFLYAMKSDLRNLHAAQEHHASEHDGAFAGDLADLSALGLRESDGVHLDLGLTADGYAAVARHDAIDQTCALFVGSTPRAPATEPGVPGCESPGRR